MLIKLQLTYLDHSMHIAFWSSELGVVLDLHKDNEVQIMPHVVFIRLMLIKGHRLVVKIAAVQS